MCSTLLLPNLPVNYFRITRGNEMILAAPMANGSSFKTTYIHSLQLTPVIDEYRISGGKIWTWEERVQSHNAGLPFEAPSPGRFIMDPPWMIVQGGRRTFEQIVYRVGTEELGQNIWQLDFSPEIKAYELYPSSRVAIGASIEALGSAITKEL